MNQEDEGAARRLGFPVDPPGGTVETESERRCVQDDLRGGTHPCKGDRLPGITIRRIALAEANPGGLWDESLNLYPRFGGTPRLRARMALAGCRQETLLRYRRDGAEQTVSLAVGTGPGSAKKLYDLPDTFQAAILVVPGL
jgi:hypothetical protein